MHTYIIAFCASFYFEHLIDLERPLNYRWMQDIIYLFCTVVKKYPALKGKCTLHWTTN